MELPAAEGDRRFLSRFARLWEVLETNERSHSFFSLDPAHRYWIDTYPPLPAVADRPARGLSETELARLSRECRDGVFSLYFHLGFCPRRCAYCRQYEIKVVPRPDHSDVLARYVERLCEDVDLSLRHFPYLRARTRGVYFGGGTPSWLPPRLLASLVEHLVARIDLSYLAPQSTFEVNPEAADDAVLGIVRAIAIPRASVGVQSFDDEILRRTGRGYSGVEAIRVVERVAARGFPHVNVDLIDGFPAHRDFDRWRRELEVLGRLFRTGAVTSATVYPLHYFPGTPLASRPGDARWQARNLSFAREKLCGELGLHEGPVYWFHRERTPATNTFGEALSVFGYGNSSYSSLGRWLLLNEPSLERYLEHGSGRGERRTLPIQRAVKLTPTQVRIRSLLFAIRAGRFRLSGREMEQLPASWRTALDRFRRDRLLAKKRDVYSLTEAGKAFAYQMPLYFFDARTRAALLEYLASRFG